MHINHIFEKMSLVINMNYNFILKKLREDNKMTQEELAKEIKISRVQYNQYENGYFNIPIKHLISICNYYNISVDYIFGFTLLINYENIETEINSQKAGQRLKEFRKDHNLTQVKLAAFLNTTFSSIAFNEKGRNLISTPFLYAICQKYKISADYILGRIDEPKYLK